MECITKSRMHYGKLLFTEILFIWPSYTIIVANTITITKNNRFMAFPLSLFLCKTRKFIAVNFYFLTKKIWKQNNKLLTTQDAVLINLKLVRYRLRYWLSYIWFSAVISLKLLCGNGQSTEMSLVAFHLLCPYQATLTVPRHFPDNVTD